MIEVGSVLIAPVRTAFVGLIEPDHRAGRQYRPAIEVVPAVLGAKAGAIGAALLARA